MGRWKVVVISILSHQTFHEVQMNDELNQKYYVMVLTPFHDYLLRRKSNEAGLGRDKTSAMTAAKGLFHFREHLPDSIAISQAEIERICPDYGLLGDAVNADKHNKLSRDTPHGPPYLNSSDDIQENMLVILFEDDEGGYRYSQKRVMLRLKGGGERDILDVFFEVANFWEQYLVEKGVKDSAGIFKKEKDLKFRTREECSDGGFDHELVRGLSLSIQYSIYKYDTTEQKIKPFDLSNCTIHSRVYRPAFDVEAKIINQKTGKVYSKIVKLSDENSQVIVSIDSEEEKSEYVQGTKEVQEAYLELLKEAEDGE